MVGNLGRNIRGFRPMVDRAENFMVAWIMRHEIDEKDSLRLLRT